MAKHYLLAFLLNLFFNAVCLSQTSKGTDFTFSFMENLPLAANGKPVFSVIVSAKKATDGIIFLELYQKSMPFSLLEGQSKEIFLSDSILNPIGSDVIAKTGIRVTTTQPIQLTARHYKKYFSESALILPTEILGSEYIVTTYSESGRGLLGGFNTDTFIVVATEDNTTIEVTLADSLDNNAARKKNEPYFIKLSRNEVYQIIGATDSKLTGTVIRSVDSKKIAIFSGSKYTTIGRYEGINHVYDQQLPTKMWGKFYAFVPFAKRKQNNIRIVAAEDSVTVRIGCEIYFLYKRRNYLNLILDSAVIIYSDKNISVGQIMRGGQEDSYNFIDATALGDPNLQMLLPLQWQSKVSFYKRKTDTTNSFFYANIILLDSTKHLLKVNGQNRVNDFKPFPLFPQLVYAQLSLKDSVSTITSDAGFIGYAYHLSPFDATTEGLGFDYYNPKIKDPYVLPRFPDTLTIAPNIWCNDRVLYLNPTITFAYDRLVWYFEDGTKSYNRTTQIVMNKKGLYGIWLEVIRTLCGEKKQYFQDVKLVNCADSLQTNGAQLCDIKAFPNPFTNYLEIQSFKNIDKTINLEIFDTAGRLISQSNISIDGRGNADFVPVPHASGLYILKYTTNNGQKCFQKIVRAN